MDTSSALKRRRPFHDGDDLYESYHQSALVSASPTGDVASPLSPENQFILQQAALILQVPIQDLVLFMPEHRNSYIIEQAAILLQSTPQRLMEFSYPNSASNFYKRTRRSLDGPPTHHLLQDSMDRSLPEKPLDPAAVFVPPAQSRRTSGIASSLLGVTASSVVNCLPCLTACPTTSSFEPAFGYQATTAAAEPSVPFTTSANTQIPSTPHEVPYMGNAPPLLSVGTNWLSGNDGESTPYLPGYPAMQPTVAAQVQPLTQPENMYYPAEPVLQQSQQLQHTHQPQQSPQQLQQLQQLQQQTHLSHPQVFAKTEDVDEKQHLEATATASSFPPPPQLPVASIPISVFSDGISLETSSAPPLPPLINGPGMPTSSITVASTPAGTSSMASPVDDINEVGGGLASHAVSHVLAASQYTVASQAYAHQQSYAVQQPQQQHQHQIKQQEHDAFDQSILHHVANEAVMDMAAQSHSRPPAARRGPFKDHNERQKTAQTRKIGSCVRCRMQRIRCNYNPDNMTGECLGCKKSLSRTWRLPCLRLKINDVVLSKTCQVKGYEWTLRWKENTVFDDVGNWASSEVKIIRVADGCTDDYVELRVRRFVPQDGDRLDRSWVTPGGELRSVNIPSFAIVEPESARSQYMDYIKRGLVSCCKRVLAGHQGTLIWSTYYTALNLANRSYLLSEQERQLLNNTLDLWMTVRLTTRSFEIVGDETLGMPRNILDETNPSCGKIPLPPVMGAQLDSLLIHSIQNKLRHDTLDGLHKLTTENKTRTWFTTYLVTFILLHNAAMVIKHDASYAKKHGIKRRFAREDKVQQYYTGAITLLAYFHYCNKGVFPFSETARDQDIRNLASLDPEATEFVRHTRSYAIANKAQWQAVRDNQQYENDYFFISQMFEANWEPQKMQL